MKCTRIRGIYKEMEVNCMEKRKCEECGAREAGSLREAGNGKREAASIREVSSPLF